MKLFWKSRFNNLKSEKIFSYLKYAFGEILLVVIGILVAVYINNKNEERKHRNEIDNIFSIIEIDLINDIEEAESIIFSEEKKEKYYNLFINNKLTKEDYEKKYILRRLVFGYLEISFNKRGYNLLNEHKSLDTSKDSLIIKTIELYTHRIDEVKADDQLREIEFKETFKYWKTQEWWEDYIMGFKDRDNFNSVKFIDYALNSKDYKNRVTTSRFINSFVFLPELKKFIKDAKEVLNLIELRKNKQFNN